MNLVLETLIQTDMAMVSGNRSTLNPNARPFIPAAFGQVEDFSPEWWDLVKTSVWFRDYWLGQHQESLEEYEDEDDIADLLPDSLQIDCTDELSDQELKLEEPVFQVPKAEKLPEEKFELSEAWLPPVFRFCPTDAELITYYLMNKVLDSSFTGRAISEVDFNKLEPWEIPASKAIVEKKIFESLSLSLKKTSKPEPARYREKPPQCARPKYSSRRIQQPR